MKHLTIGGLWIAVAAVLPACTSNDEAAPKNPATAAPNLVSLSSTEYAFRAPDTISPGWTTFRIHNHGTEIHYGHIVQLDSGKTVPEMVGAYEEAIRSSGPRPAWVTRFGGPGGVAPGDSSSVTQYLDAGSYVWVCPVEDPSGAPHFGKGEFKPFVVRVADSADPGGAAAPVANVSVRLLDFSFALDSPLTAGRHIVRVVNEGEHGHDLVLMKLEPGITIEDVRAGMNPEAPRRSGPRREPPSPERLGTLAGGVAAMRSSMEAFFETTLTPGEYVLICMTTAPDGRSHIEHGMIQQITVQ